MGEGQRPAETAASLEISADAELLLAVGEQRFKLRIAFKAFRHIAHFRPCGFVSGHVACLILPLAGLIDLAAERARLGKELEQAEGDIARREAKLGNAGFVDKAPANVVQRERDGLAAARAAAERLRERLAQLSG